MSAKAPREIQAHRRAIIQSAKFAIRDVYDAIVELVTNSDDRYQVLSRNGTIEVEVERRRGASPSLLRVRDYADGMDANTMERKLSVLGGRESGLSDGAEVRGTHSRGAKDIAALGRVTFESIATDGQYHMCEITPFLEFVMHESTASSKELRRKLGIPTGTGTLVTIELDESQRVPQHDNLLDQIQRLVPIRGILRDEKRTFILKDLGKDRKDTLKVPGIEATTRVKEVLEIPGYSGVTAKLFVHRAKEKFERERDRFRLGGIQIESKRGIHEATLFDSALESDSNAQWFFGRLVCPYIDELCNEFDDRFEAHELPSKHNPTYPLDPSRRSGLNREHPFVQALFGEALKRLRPLVDEERRREEQQKAQIESDATRKRLDALEKAALDFMRDFGSQDEPALDPDGTDPESRFVEKGYALSPPFAQMVVGSSRLFWISIRQETFPELEVGSGVQIECLSPEIVSDKRFCGLEKHPTRDGVLRAIWKVKALTATSATGLRVRVGSITAESPIEVLASEADKYRDIIGLQFDKSRYRLRTDQKRKRIRLLAPIDLVPVSTPIRVEVGSSSFILSGNQMLLPNRALNISLCDLFVSCSKDEASTSIVAHLGSASADATITSAPPLGADLKIKLEDIDLGNQRYRWRQNVLEIAARHPSLRRYLGDAHQRFPGQESKHFRLLVAEVVADAVCALLVRRNVQTSPEEFEDADWDSYYALYSKYMTGFLPKAHQLQSPEP